MTTNGHKLSTWVPMYFGWAVKMWEFIAATIVDEQTTTPTHISIVYFYGLSTVSPSHRAINACEQIVFHFADRGWVRLRRNFFDTKTTRADGCQLSANE